MDFGKDIHMTRWPMTRWRAAHVRTGRIDAKEIAR
jgi:hypothetical protein